MKYMKDYKQFLAEGGEIRNKDGTKVIEAHKWADDSYAFLYSDGTGVSRVFERDIVEYHTFRAPRERVKTWHCWDDYGVVSGFPSSDTPYAPIGYTITEKREDGSWVIIETTLKAQI